MSAWLKNVDVLLRCSSRIWSARSCFTRISLACRCTFKTRTPRYSTFGDTCINMINIPAARELIEPRAVASREVGSRFQFTIHVDDVDAICAELATQGVALLNGPMNRPWGIRTASFTDPGGHIWEIAGTLPQAEGS
jgi:predicted enzyme related to lactoylglutathione lyase